MNDVIRFVRANPHCTTTQIENALIGLGYKLKSIHGQIGNARRYGHIQVTCTIYTHRREHTFI